MHIPRRIFMDHSIHIIFYNLASARHEMSKCLYESSSAVGAKYTALSHSPYFPIIMCSPTPITPVWYTDPYHCCSPQSVLYWFRRLSTPNVITQILYTLDEVSWSHMVTHVLPCGFMKLRQHCFRHWLAALRHQTIVRKKPLSGKC